MNILLLFYLKLLRMGSKTTLKYLVKKDGYYGKLDDIIDNIQTERYQSLKTTFSYDEWKDDM